MTHKMVIRILANQEIDRKLRQHQALSMAFHLTAKYIIITGVLLNHPAGSLGSGVEIDLNSPNDIHEHYHYDKAYIHLTFEWCPSQWPEV